MLVIFNPVAGRRRAALLWRVLDLLVENGIKVEVTETQHAGHAIELARAAVRDGRGMVVAAGGDGTIAEVANGLLGSDTALGIIPLGTANVLAKEYKLSTAPRAIANALAYRRTLPLWPGIARWDGRDHVFVQMVGLGFDGAVVHGLQPLLKRMIGRGAYVWQALWELVAYGFPTVRLTIDGTNYEAASVVVSKGRLYGGAYPAGPPRQLRRRRASRSPCSSVPAPSPPCSPAPPCRSACCRAAPACGWCRATIEFAAGKVPILSQADGDVLAFTPTCVVNADSPINLVVGQGHAANISAHVRFFAAAGQCAGRWKDQRRRRAARA